MTNVIVRNIDNETNEIIELVTSIVFGYNFGDNGYWINYKLKSGTHIQFLNLKRYRILQVY